MMKTANGTPTNYCDWIITYHTPPLQVVSIFCKVKFRNIFPVASVPYILINKVFIF